MANLAQIQSIAQGQFFVKDSLGNLTELKVGDTVSLNDIIVAASSNTDLSKIEILFDTNELIILSQGEQLLDATLLASTFGNEELAFDKQEVDETLNAWNNAQDGDATDMETAAGDVTEQATNAGNEEAADGGALRSKFNSRDGSSTDVRSDLRDTSFGGGNTEEPQEQIPTELLNPVGTTTPTTPTTPTIPVDTRVPASVITLSDPTVDEGNQITILATVTNPPQTDLIITLNNGQTITISAGQTTGSTTFTNPNSEDVYIDNSTEIYTITGITGGNYVSLDTSDKGTVTVNDTTTTGTKVTVENVTVSEGGTATVGVSVNADTKVDLVVTLDAKDANGNNIQVTIPAGTPANTAITSPEFVINNGDDVYVDGSSFEVGIVSTNNDATQKDNFEALDTSDKGTVTVNDTTTTGTKVTVENVTVSEGGTATVGVSVNADTKVDLVVTLDAKDANGNNIQVTIPAGTPANTAITSPEFVINNGDDVYVDGSSFEVGIVSTNNDATQKDNFEALDTSDKGTVTVNDTTTTGTKVTVENVTVSEGGTATVGVSVNADTKVDLVVTLDAKDANGNNIQVTIPAGTPANTAITSPEFVINNGDDVYVDGSSFEVGIVSTNNDATQKDNFEALDTSDKGTVTVNDTTTTGTKVTVENVTVSEGGTATVGVSVNADTKVDLVVTLDAKDANGNNIQVTIPAGTPANTAITSPEFVINNGDDVYVDGSSFEVGIVSTNNDATQKDNFEALDTSDKGTVTVNDTTTPIDVTITATVTTPKIIDVNTKTDGTTGVKVTGYNSDGKETNLSIIKGTNHDGFGVDGKNLSNGDTKELGVGEKIVVEFTNGKDVNSLDVSFAWRNNHETAKLTFVKDGKIVGYATVDGDGKSTTKAFIQYYDDKEVKIGNPKPAEGSSDRVDKAFTFELPDSNGEIVSFDKVEFSAPKNKDDYLINKIVYKEVLDPTVTDIVTNGGNVTFNIQVDENYPPQGKATAIVMIHGETYEVPLNATGRGTLTIDSKNLGDLSKVEAKVIEVIGGKYEKVNEKEEKFDFTQTVNTPTSKDDTISTDEDVAYTLKVTDFGEVSSNTKEFKITELPTPEIGKLFLNITKGETIFNPDGTKTEATQDSKVEVSKGQVISLAQVGAGQVVFEPTANSDVDGQFKFQVGDGNGNFSSEYTTTIDVKAVADAPIVSIDIKEIITSTKIEVKNLGINLNASQSNGNGGNKTSSHKIDLGESISSVNINVSKVENGVVRFYDNNGNQVGQTVSIASINGSYSPGKGLEFSSFEVVNLGGQGKGTAAFKFDGYSYTSTASDKVTYEIEYSAKLTDGSEELSDFIIKNIPENSKLFGAVLANKDGSYTVKVDGTGKAKLTLESQDKLSEDELNSIKASATSTEDSNGDSATATVSQNLGNDIDLSGLKDILEEQKTGDIDLSKNGSQDKLTLTLDDVLKLSGDDKQIKITGDQFDSVTFKNTIGEDGKENAWSKTASDEGFDIYVNSGDESLKVKVEQPISDGITN